MAMPERYDRPENQGDVVACIRPEHVRLDPERDAAGLMATVTSLEFLGSFWRATLAVPELDGPDLAVDCTGKGMAVAPVQVGQTVRAILPVQEVGVFPAAGRPPQSNQAVDP